IKNWGSAAIACLITLYFFRKNLIGIHESSGKAMKIMILTTVMAIVVLGWCGLTLVMKGGPEQAIPLKPDFAPKMNYDKDQIEDPLGFIGKTEFAKELRPEEPEENPINWWSLVGLAGIMIAFGHSILA